MSVDSMRIEFHDFIARNDDHTVGEIREELRALVNRIIEAVWDESADEMKELMISELRRQGY